MADDDEPKWAGPQTRSSVFHPVQFKGWYEGSQGASQGSAFVSPDGRFTGVQVPKGERDKGHGSKILQQVTDDADKYGRGLKLNTFENHKFYTDRGFQMTGHDYIGGIATPRLEYKPKDIEGI